jgi:hypothetical protein
MALANTYAVGAMVPGAIGGVGGYYYGQATGMDFAQSMQFAALTSTATDLVSGLFIKCFVGDTPVWIPAGVEYNVLVAAGEAASEGESGRASVMQIAAGIYVAMLTAVSFHRLSSSKTTEKQRPSRQKTIDSVFGSPDDSWGDVADLLWSDPHDPKDKFAFR